MRRLRAGLFALLLALGACAQAEPEAAPSPSAAEWLMSVRSAHLQADGALSAGELERAASVLRGVAGVGVPSEVSTEHGRVVLQDLMFRLAEVELERAQHDAALVAADAGLAHGRGDDVFTANLLIARGAALEAKGRDTEAAASYYEALEINRALLAELLEAPDGGGR